MDIRIARRIVETAQANPPPEAAALRAEEERWVAALVHARRTLRDAADHLMEFHPHLQDELCEAARGLPDSEAAYQFLMERAEDCARRWGVAKTAGLRASLDRAAAAYREAARLVG